MQKDKLDKPITKISELIEIQDYHEAEGRRLCLEEVRKELEKFRDLLQERRKLFSAKKHIDLWMEVGVALCFLGDFEAELSKLDNHSSQEQEEKALVKNNRLRLLPSCEPKKLEEKG